MISEIPTLKLKLYPNTLPSAGCELPLCLAVGEARLHSLDHVSEFSRNYSIEKNNAVLVRGFVPKATKIYGASVGLAVT
jgi:hypothetical protein